MRRRWTSFNHEVTNREFFALSQRDFASLTVAMRAFRMDEGAGYVVKHYGEGLMMIKSANQTQGRCLFFTIREERNQEVLVALLVYKKESDAVPHHVEATARRRMEEAK